jgi:hypothetical protein
MIISALVANKREQVLFVTVADYCIILYLQISLLFLELFTVGNEKLSQNKIAG